jgi:hypothetical protein
VLDSVMLCDTNLELHARKVGDNSG